MFNDEDQTERLSMPLYHTPLHADVGQGAQHGRAVRHPAFSHRPPALPSVPHDCEPLRDVPWLLGTALSASQY
jgi:hypothetical protein